VKKLMIFLASLFIMTSSLFCTFIIDTPGTYKLGSDITYTLTINNDTAILITSSYVVLDIQGHHITQLSPTCTVLGKSFPTTRSTQSSCTFTGLDFIVLSPNISFVTIMNGTIQNIPGRGIVVNQGCSNITIDQIFTFSCDQRGIEIAGVSSNQVSTLDIKNSKASNCCMGPYGDYPVYIHDASNVRVVNCLVSQNGVPSNNISGVRIENCSTSRFEDMRVNTNVGGTIVKGFDISNVGDSFFLTCITHNNNPSNSAGSAFGFDFENSCTDNFLVNCVALASSATMANTTYAGFQFGAGCNNNVLTNCKVSQNSADGTCHGFSSLSNTGNSFIDCLALNNKSLNGVVRGYNVNGCSNNVHVRCIAHGNNSTNSIAVGMDYNGCTECFNQESFITKNQGTNSANSYGIRLQNDSSSGFVKNVAMRNGTTADNQLNGLSVTQKNNQSINAVNGAWSNIGLN
jgi:hypothetical protein